MSDPIVFISHFKIKEGKLDGLKELNQQVSGYIQQTRPGTVAFLQFINDEGTELSIIHMFPDSASFDRHVEGVDERSNKSVEFVVPTSREIYGKPSDEVMTMLIPPQGSEIELKVFPQISGGYIR